MQGKNKWADVHLFFTGTITYAPSNSLIYLHS